VSEKSVAQKMAMKAGHKVLTLAAPKGYADLVGGLPEGAKVVKKGAADFVHLFVADSAALDRELDGALAALGDETLFWISYPKKTSGMVSDLTRDVLWKLVEPKGWEPVTQIAIDETWSAMRFKKSGTIPARNARAAKPAEAKPAQKGARTVAVPDDLAEALNAAPEARARFEELAYSHRKEYVTWIEEAKKPETRARRVAGTIDKLLA
jgi:hypothetical protein